MTALKLFEISAQFKELEALAITDDLPTELVADTMESLTGDFNDKAIAVAQFILSLEANAEEIDKAAKAMKIRAERVQRRADSVRAYLQFQMQTVGIKRIECAQFILNRRLNTPAVQITDDKTIPVEYWVQPDPPPPRIDKIALRSALSAGTRVEGAYLESAERLVIQI